MRFTFFISFFFLLFVSLSTINAQKYSAPRNYAIKKLGSSVVSFKDENSKLWGFKKINGDIAIPAKFTFAYAFSDGFAAVNMGGEVRLIDEYTDEYVVVGGKWGYINKQGELVIPLQFDGADFFENGFAIVEKNTKKTFIDKTGKAITEFKYDFVNPFCEGLAAVGGGRPLEFTFIDKTGKTVISHDFSAAGDFYKGRARVTRQGANYFINKSGERMR